MATYLWRCPLCGANDSTSDRALHYCPSGDGVAMLRNYRAENVGVAVAQLKTEREAGGRAEYDKLFLPSNAEFAGPGDPDGTKGMRKWRDTHQPKPGNKNPRWPGTVDRADGVL